MGVGVRKSECAGIERVCVGVCVGKMCLNSVDMLLLPGSRHYFLFEKEGLPQLTWANDPLLSLHSGRTPLSVSLSIFLSLFLSLSPVLLSLTLSISSLSSLSFTIPPSVEMLPNKQSFSRSACSPRQNGNAGQQLIHGAPKPSGGHQPL